MAPTSARLSPKLPFVTGIPPRPENLYTVGALIYRPGVFTMNGVFLVTVVHVQYTSGETILAPPLPTVPLKVVSDTRLLDNGTQTLASVV